MELINQTEQARLWKVSRKTIARLVQEGMPCHRVGSMPRFDPVETMQWLRQNKSAPVAGKSEAGACSGEDEQVNSTSPATPSATAGVVLTQRGRVNITGTLRRLNVGQDVAIKTDISYVKAIASKTGHVYDCQRDGQILRVRRVS